MTTLILIHGKQETDKEFNKRVLKKECEVCAESIIIDKNKVTLIYFESLIKLHQ